MTIRPESIPPGGLDPVQLFTLLREECRKAGGQRAYAASKGISESYLSDVLNARREAGPAILAAIGLRKVTRYVTTRSERPAA